MSQRKMAVKDSDKVSCDLGVNFIKFPKLKSIKSVLLWVVYFVVWLVCMGISPLVPNVIFIGLPLLYISWYIGFLIIGITLFFIINNSEEI